MLWKSGRGYGQKADSDSRRRRAAADAENPADAAQAAGEAEKARARRDAKVSQKCRRIPQGEMTRALQYRMSLSGDWSC